AIPSARAIFSKMAPLPTVHRINIRPVQYEDTALAPHSERRAPTRCFVTSRLFRRRRLRTAGFVLRLAKHAGEQSMPLLLQLLHLAQHRGGLVQVRRAFE